jgi:multimeric flavodoxin WrbA
MNHVLVLEGSPRKGNTSQVVDWVLAGMGRGTRLDRIRLSEVNIHPCQECYKCIETKDGPGCQQEDYMVELYDKLVSADIVIWASPVFCWNVSAQTKMVLDRCFALLTGEELLKDSKWALVLTGGGDAFDGADLAVQVFHRLTEYAGIKLVGEHVVAPCPDGKKLMKDADLESKARKFGKELAKALRA